MINLFALNVSPTQHHQQKQQKRPNSNSIFNAVLYQKGHSKYGIEAKEKEILVGAIKKEWNQESNHEKDKTKNTRCCQCENKLTVRDKCF